MTTILRTHYTPPTPEELQALMRQAHQERSEVIRGLLSGPFRRRRETKAEPAVTYAALRPSL